MSLLLPLFVFVRNSFVVVIFTQSDISIDCILWVKKSLHVVQIVVAQEDYA